MENQEVWYTNISRQIEELRDQLSIKEEKRYKLAVLLRLAKRVADFSNNCQHCHYSKGRIRLLFETLRNIPQMSPGEYKDYQAVIKDITRHLKKEHRLVDEKQYLKRFVSLAATLGLTLIAFGYVLLNFGITILVLSFTLPALFVRMIFGYTIGYLLDKRAKKQGRVI